VIAIVDYGVSNLRSVQKALEQVGAQATITDDVTAIRQADGVLLPGVGAFGDAMEVLNQRGLAAALWDVFKAGTPLLGICLGMQLLFEESDEMGLYRGLGMLPGRVIRFGAGLKVPHIGWNQVHPRRVDGLLAGVHEGDYAYFVHSYYVEPANTEITSATTDYGVDFASVIERGRVFGIQFHPEKSQDVGLRILQNFAAVAGPR
jgi:imidazole glycerol-phosphate synthase subunit HisH